MKFTLHKQIDCFYPYDDESVENCKKLTENGIYIVDIKGARNPRFHGYAMAMLRQLYDMVDTELSFDPWRKMLTIKAGFYSTIGKVSVDGVTSVAVISDSLAFESMSEDEFRSCFNSIIDAFGNKYGKELTLDQLTEWSRI